MIYSINMHTTVYQFWRFVYHHGQSVIDHYARISLYIILNEDQIARKSFIMAPIFRMGLSHITWRRWKKSSAGKIFDRGKLTRKWYSTGQSIDKYRLETSPNYITLWSEIGGHVIHEQGFRFFSDFINFQINEYFRNSKALDFFLLCTKGTIQEFLQCS